jgi:hypothetical protein
MHYFLIKCGAILHLNVFLSFIFSIVSQFFFSMLFVNFFSTIFLLDFGNVPIVWYVFHFFTLPFVLFLWYLVVQTRQKWLECENRNKDHPPSSQCFGIDMVLSCSQIHLSKLAFQSLPDIWETRRVH